MTSSRKTKRAWLGSVVALLLCLAMLIGTTFAWFTDSASTGVNTIRSGNLDVALEMKTDDGWVSAEGRTLDFVKAAGHENEAILWEPGCTYALPALRIRNNGDLALKYKVIITGINGNAKLNEVIDWTIGDAAMGAEQHLNAGESSEFTISGHMQKTADNDYMGLTIRGISITVYATQDTVEYDSTTNQYDKNARYLIETSSYSGTVYNNVDVTLDSYDIRHLFMSDRDNGMAFYLTNGAKLTLNDCNLTTTVDPDNGKRNIGFYVYNGSELTINSGNYTMDGQWSAMIWAQGGASGGARSTVTINGGNFKVKGNTNLTIVNAYSGSGYSGADVYITGGFFDLSEANANVTLQWKSDCTMRVTGGTFVNYNPAHHGAVPAGYKVETLPQSDGKTWYKVVPENAALVSDEDDLNAAMGGSIILTDDITANAATTSAAGYGSIGVAAVNVNGTLLDGEGHTLTVTNANRSWDCGVYTNGGTIKNVTIDGAFRGILTGGLTSDLYMDNVVFENVVYTFSADGSGDYDVVFKNCTLNGWTSFTSGFKSVSFTGCTFGEGNGYSYCRPYSASTFTNCTFETGYEFDAGEATCTFVNCYVGTTLITSGNVTTLLGADAAGAVINNH